VITYRATLDVARPIGAYLAQLLADERARRGTRRGRRALTVFAQAVLVLRWFRDATPVARLATDTGISPATAYRYLHEGITVLAAQAPDLPEVLAQRAAAGDTHVILDGTPIRTTRVAGKVIKTKGPNAGKPVHRWYSGKYRTFCGNIQFLAAADGFPLWCSDVLPGGTHNDLAAARAHQLIGALCAAAARGLLTLADKAYHAAGIGILTPIKDLPGNHPLHGRPLTVDEQAYNLLHACVRGLGERAAALLKTRWRALHRVTLSPSRIGAIVQAALVLTQHEHQGRY
jgi:DDE superfamily endonuclease